MDADVDARSPVCLAAFDLLGDREQLDDAARAARGGDVLRRDVHDALDVHVTRAHARVEREGGEDGGLRLRVVALDVGRRVGLGVTELLRLGEHVLQVGAGAVHLVEDEVRRAVDDAEHLRHPIARERLAQRTDERDGARDGGLVGQVDAVIHRELVQLRAIAAEQGLVGRDDARAVAQGARDEALGGLVTTHELDDDVGTVDERLRVRREGVGRQARLRAVLARVAHRDADDLQRRTDTGLEIGGVLGQLAGDGRADDAAAEQRDRDRLARGRRVGRHGGCGGGHVIPLRGRAGRRSSRGAAARERRRPRRR